jgi:hypothetical protein
MLMKMASQLNDLWFERFGAFHDFFMPGHNGSPSQPDRFFFYSL